MIWADFWRDLFAENTSLVHVDFSHNNLEKRDVESFSEGLKSNHTIMGVHFLGNQGEIDGQGFLKAR